MIDLDRGLDRASPHHHELDVEHVDEYATFRGDPATDRAQRGADVEQMVDRLAEEDQVIGAVAEIDVLREARDRLHAGLRGVGELVRGRIENGGVRAEGVAEGAGDDTRGAADVEQRVGLGR